MEWPEHTLILGNCPEARALVQLLTFTETDCHVYDIMAENESFSVGIVRDLNESSLVIALASEGMPSLDLRNVAVRLRNDHQWRGGAFLSIVQSPDHKEQLLGSNLLPGQDYLFRNVPGHDVICRPILIADLYRVITEVNQLFYYSWQRLREESGAQLVVDQVENAEKLCESGDLAAASIALKELYRRIAKIDWFCLLRVPHRDANLAREYLANHPLEHAQSLDGCKLALASVRRLLSRTIIGGGEML
jgi:hypothetical protein